MSNEVLVTCENVSKKFCRNLKRSLWYGVRDVCAEFNPFRERQAFLGTENIPGLRKDDFWAVKDISFELRRGECLGLIGYNGAGKSTLLKMLNGLIKPDHGRIAMTGRIGALIELNAGFDPVLTGRENIYIYGSILGFSKKKIDKKFNEIVEFSELKDFIGMPLRSYSSGMKVRLGFAVASQMDPDVLLVDEVLAVGDRPFRLKCYNRITELKENTTIIFVSHNMFDIVRVCTKGCILNNGVVDYIGATERAIDHYNTSINSNYQDRMIFTKDGISLCEFRIETPEIEWGGQIVFHIAFESEFEVKNTYQRFIITDIAGNVVAEWNSSQHNFFYDIQKGHNTIEGQIDNIRLRNDKYNVNLVLTKDSGSEYLIAAHQAGSFIVINGIYTSSVYVL